MKKLLVANRGEIAIRIFRTAREMGIPTVAVFSDADRDALHVEHADEAVWIGPPEPSLSYLNIDSIIKAAQDSGADAIHPGYGFLSERPEFAEACEAAGITFIGPSAAAMRMLGSKADAKRLAVELGVPIVPGYFEPAASYADLARAADRIGYPVMLKASAGGGGRGMRIVHEPSTLEAQAEMASTEALKAFGDGTMMVEKLIERPRHIEVQLLADKHGEVACLYERECSIQRRHQKLIEESPSPLSMDELWPRMRESAQLLAKGAGYVGAGTVEFIVDQDTGSYYFLEVNARLQVEHPVTESVTGLDLVRWQIQIADGQKLDLPERLMIGDREGIYGHSIEVRIIAEDPAAGFLPSIGTLKAWHEPRSLGTRVDTGYGHGREVPRFYDSLLAKVIVHGETRDVAVQRLHEALMDFHVLGVRTNLAYMLDVIGHPEFAKGEFDTGYLERYFQGWNDACDAPELGAIVQHATPVGGTNSGSSGLGVWSLGDGFRNVRGT